MMGDAYMRPQDAEIAALSVQGSLEQLLDAASGKTLLDYKNDNFSSTCQPDTFSVCKNNFSSSRNVKADFLFDVLSKTPVPGLATGAGEHPRFRAELGPFLGVSTSIHGSGITSGFGTQQTQAGCVGGIEANLRFGVGLDGVLNQAGDGLVFIQGGWKLDGPSSNVYSDIHNAATSGSLTAAITSRSAYNIRVRLPFWLIPGDLHGCWAHSAFHVKENFSKNGGYCRKWRTNSMAVRLSVFHWSFSIYIRQRSRCFFLRVDQIK